MTDRKVYTNKKYIKFLYKCFYEIHNVLIENNITYYASGGTLLGAVRHKGIIQWDDDIDLEISYKDIPQVLNLKKQLSELGYKIVKHSESKNELDWIKINSVKKVDGRICSIDLFPVYIEDGRTWFQSDFTNDIWPKAYHKVKDLYPLQQMRFGSGKIICPRYPNPYLSRSYGRSWSKVGYITLDVDHIPLDKPIKVQSGGFTAGEEFASSTKQIKLRNKDPLLTGVNTLFYS